MLENKILVEASIPIEQNLLLKAIQKEITNYSEILDLPSTCIQLYSFKDYLLGLEFLAKNCYDILEETHFSNIFDLLVENQVISRNSNLMNMYQGALSVIKQQTFDFD